MKEKLSIRSIEYFGLALEEQYNLSRLHLLHEEELIQQVGKVACVLWGGTNRAGSDLSQNLCGQGSVHAGSMQ